MSPEPPGAGSSVPPSPPGGGPHDRFPTTTEQVRPRFAAGAERVEPPRVRRVPEDPRPPSPGPGAGNAGPARSGRRARKVRRVVRHIEPWSVLKISMLFYLVLFLIISVAATVLWGVGRQTGSIENVEDFITELGVFGDCEPIDGAEAPTTPTTLTTILDQADQVPVGPDGEALDGSLGQTQLRDDDGCLIDQEEFVGSFRFEGAQLFQAFIVGGLVLVLAGAAASVVLAVLFNLISDLTGGVRVTVLEEEPTTSPGARRTGSPAPRSGG